jgi:hypothetical protein
MCSTGTYKQPRRRVLGLCHLHTCACQPLSVCIPIPCPSPSFVAPVAQDWGQRFDLRRSNNTVINYIYIGQLSTQTPAASLVGATTVTILRVPDYQWHQWALAHLGDFQDIRKSIRQVHLFIIILRVKVLIMPSLTVNTLYKSAVGVLCQFRRAFTSCVGLFYVVKRCQSGQMGRVRKLFMRYPSTSSTRWEILYMRVTGCINSKRTIAHP